MYYRLTKPGIIYGNLLTTTGGFLYGSILHIHVDILLGIIAGTWLIIASGCVINNVFDRDIDIRMSRTKRRATATGQISARNALLLASVLAVAGTIILLILTNPLTTLLGLAGLVSYAGVYTYAKRHTVHATLIGTLPGAIPPVAGYTAATNSLDSSALLLFLILVSWQMAHFYSIALFRLKDYKAAKIPVMPAVYGEAITRLQILFYAGLFLLSIVGLAKFGYAGLLYLAVMVPLTLWWLAIIFTGVWNNSGQAWARKIFFLSLIMLPALSIVLSLNAWVP